MRTTARAMLLALLIDLVLVIPGSPAGAGTVRDYPEFPYPPTSYTEPSRGQFHFSSRAGWMNDPNGLVYAGGLYHFFYQHNPHGLGWDTMHWGHATSPDLVHWTQKPIALEPDVHPGALWSGAGVVDTNNTAGLRTGNQAPIVVFSNTDGVSLYYSNDNGDTFQAYDRGRKLVSIPSPSRDPKVFWHTASGRWVMVVWSDTGGNGVNIYTSPNLIDWTQRSRYQASWLFECPDFFALPVDGNAGNVRWVMTDASGEYVIGSFDGATFRPEWTVPQRMDRGNTSPDGTFYAAQTFNNMPDGRVVQMAWQPGNRGSVWTGNASFPARLGLVTTSSGVRITRTPVVELGSLRTSSTNWSNVVVGPSSDPFAGFTADTYEINAEFDLTGATASQFGFDLHRRADGTSGRTVLYDRAAQTLYGAPLPPVNGRVKVRLLVDRGQLEIFGNDGLLSITDNVTFDSASQGIRLFATGGSVRLVSAQVNRLGTAWGRGESTLVSNAAGPWTAVGGTWADVTGGKQGSGGGDSYYLSSRSGADFTYEGDLRLDTAVAAALTFRSDATATGHYTANIDAAGLVKLWRPGREIATFATPIVRDRSYHLKVVAVSSRIRVYLDNGSNPVIDATDTTYASGLLGANVYAGTGTVQNLTVDGPGFATFTAGPWRPVGGMWTVTTGGLRGSASSDAFYLSDRAGTDFTYEADLRVVNGTAAALTFRASADGTQQYSANIDTGGVVKLWRPGRDIATYPTSIVEGRTYHLKVIASGASLRVYLDNGTTPLIDATDTAYASGLFGANVFNATALLQNLRIT